MKVSELIAKLQSLTPTADVLCYTEEDNTFRILDIEDVSLSEATKVRTTGGQPSLRLGKSENSQPHVLIAVNSDF